MRQHKLWLCALLVLLLAALGAFGAAAETTVGMSGAGSFKMEQVYVNVPELDVYFYALDGDGNSYSPIKVQAAGPELTLGDRRLEVRSVAAASDPICYILALDNSKSIAPSEFYTMLGGVRKLINAMGDDDQLDAVHDGRQYRVRAAGNVGQEPDVQDAGQHQAGRGQHGHGPADFGGLR